MKDLGENLVNLWFDGKGNKKFRASAMLEQLYSGGEIDCVGAVYTVNFLLKGCCAKIKSSEHQVEVVKSVKALLPDLNVYAKYLCLRGVSKYRKEITSNIKCLAESNLFSTEITQEITDLDGAIVGMLVRKSRKNVRILFQKVAREGNISDDDEWKELDDEAFARKFKSRILSYFMLSHHCNDEAYDDSCLVDFKKAMRGKLDKRVWNTPQDSLPTR